MDLGIKGRTALVCASTKGLGHACAESLAGEGVNLVINGRVDEVVHAIAAALRDRYDVEVEGVAADLNTAEGREILLRSCPDPDIVVTNNAGPSPASFTDVTETEWLAALNANMLSAIGIVQHVVKGMQERRFGRIVNITSAMVKSPHFFMTPSVGARAGLTGVMKALSREVAKDNVTVNNLLPERIDTERQRQMAELAVSIKGITIDEAYADIAATIPAGRLGAPNEVGDVCAFLCAAQSGYLTGQNIQIDGGAYEGIV